MKVNIGPAGLFQSCTLSEDIYIYIFVHTIVCEKVKIQVNIMRLP